MKYVRTKTGHIYECHDEETIYLKDGVEISRDKRTIFENCIENLNAVGIVKEADTIEELCDWLVFKEKGRICVLYDNWDDAVAGEGNRVLAYDEVFGALDKDYGLIYVAKMNEKGELELL